MNKCQKLNRAKFLIINVKACFKNRPYLALKIDQSGPRNNSVRKNVLCFVELYNSSYGLHGLKLSFVLNGMFVVCSNNFCATTTFTSVEKSKCQEEGHVKIFEVEGYCFDTSLTDPLQLCWSRRSRKNVQTYHHKS